MSAATETNENNKTGVTEEFLAAALQDAITAHDSNMMDTESEGTELSMANSTVSDGEVSNTHPTTLKTTIATVNADVLMSDATVEPTTRYHSASSSLLDISTDTGYMGDDDVLSQEGSDVEPFDSATLIPMSGPMRKIKKKRAMNAEQQDMKMQQLKSVLSMYEANAESKAFNKAPPYPQKPPGNSTVSNPTHVNGLPSASTNGSTTESMLSSLPKKGIKRGRPSKDDPKPRAKKGRSDRKKKEQEIKPEVLSFLAKLVQLSKPEKLLKEIIDYADMPFNKQALIEGDDEPIKEMLGIEDDLKAFRAAKVKQLTALFERQGLIPIGGVEAVAAGRTTLG